MNFMIFIIFIGFCSLSYAEGIPITPPKGTFNPEILGIAHCAKQHPYLICELKPVTIRSSKKRQKATKNITGFLLGLTKHDPKIGQWNIMKKANKYDLNINIKANELVTFTDYIAYIPIDDISNLSEYWLTLELQVRNGKSTTYAHSKKGLL